MSDLAFGDYSFTPQRAFSLPAAHFVLATAYHMTRASDDAAKFNRTLAQLSESLAACDIVVSRLHAHWSSFGSWELQVQRGSETDRYHEAARLDPGHAIPPDVVRCLWDGRDHYLMIEISPRQPLSAANEWREEHAKGFDTSDEAVQYLENYLKRRFQHDSPEKV